MKTAIQLAGIALFVVVSSAVALFSARGCMRSWDEQNRAAATERQAFLDQCRDDGKTVTDCTVLWSQVNR